MRGLTLSDTALVGYPRTQPFNPWDVAYPTPLHAVYASDPAWGNPGDGNGVSSWRNQSGGGNPAQATGALQPIYRSSVAGLNNKPAVEFTAASTQWLDTDITDIAQTFKVLMIVLLKTTAAQCFLARGSGSNGGGLRVTAGPLYRTSWGANLDGGVPTTAAPKALRATLNGVSSVLRVNNSSVASGSAGTQVLARFTLGVGYDGTTPATYANAYIAYCGIYAGATADADLLTLENALRASDVYNF